MAQDINITLPSGISAPASDEIRKAKDYVLRRSQAEIALADAIDAILEKYITLIVQACWKYDMNPYDFAFGANEQLRQEVYTLLDSLEEDIYSLIEGYAVPNGEQNKHRQALVSWMLTLGTHNWNFRRTLEYYIHRASQDWEAAIAAFKFAETKQSMAITKLRAALHQPYSIPEVMAAVRHGTDFQAEMLRSGGVKYDPITHEATSGLSRVGATNITTMARSTLAMVWMRDLLLTAEEENKAGYYVFRGSSYPCPNICDTLVGFHKIEDGMVIPGHSHCYCWCVFVDSKEEKPIQYRTLNFY